MELVSLSLMAAAAGKVLDSLLGEGATDKLVASIVGGVIGNRADWVVCQATGSSWNFFKNLRTTDPALNHDLERATREAYLLATLELVRQAELQVELGASGSRLLTAGDGETLAAVRRAVESDLRDIDNVLPTAIADADLFLIDPEVAPAARLARLRSSLRANLAQDFARWLPGGDMPAVVDTLLESGWLINTKVHGAVPRDWFGLIAIAFVEKLKTTPRLSAVFEARLLARIAAAEPAASSMASFAGFASNLDTITAPLQRIEDAIGLLDRNVREIGRDVKDIKETVSGLDDLKVAATRLPRLVWMSSALLCLTAATALATGTGARVACQVPGLRAACSQFGVGGVPSATEESLWRTRPAGDCADLRAYLGRYPTGAYSAEAVHRLEARTIRQRETWTPQEKSNVFTIRAGVEAFASEEQARRDAIRRAEEDATFMCAPYAQDEYRLRSSEVTPSAWHCRTGPRGSTCGFDGVVVCHVEARHVDVLEQCQ